jgi:hypothetical protein
LGYEGQAGVQPNEYRWRKFGMPLRIANDGSFFTQPLLRHTQVRQTPSLHTHTHRQANTAQSPHLGPPMLA